ncbi:LpqN/LpqT family lipoprotein [soil metagenome]
MNKLTSVAGRGISALALGLALVGCGGSDSSTEASTSTSTTSAAEETSTTEETTTEEAEPTTPAEAAGPNQTIQDYVKENGFQETVIKRGDPGPTVNLPVPEGWQQTDELPEAPYGAIVYPASAVPNNPPRILALMSKLTGDVDPEEILNYAPGELQNMPGWAGNEGQRNQLGGFESFQIGGTYEIDGVKGMIAQKTVVIPADDGVFVLQLNAYSDESEAEILSSATQIIDDQTTITTTP